MAYLGSLLAQANRAKALNSSEKREELKDLRAFNQDIIESMRGGLLTTDLEGRILLLNRSGAEIIGHGFRAIPGRKNRRAFSGVLAGRGGRERKSASAAKGDRVPNSRPAKCDFSGISISPLRTGENQATGFVYNFQDLTELRRLEREIVTKERMAALGRLSAAIAHEIRQPLTAMTGALKELSRLAPLEDDDKKLVQIVSRESQRLNQIITDFLDYSREKSLRLPEADLSRSSKKPDWCSSATQRASERYRIERNFNVQSLRAQGGPRRDQASLVEFMQ